VRDGAPAIAVSAGFTDYGDYLGVALSRPLIAAGATPLFLPYLEDDAARAAVLDLADGVLLGFGRDIDPARYGVQPHPAMTDVPPVRDDFELALAEEALARDLPVLGICRGMQILNLARGGTLHRDRSEYPSGAEEHPGGDWALWDRVCEAAMGLGPPVEHPSHPIDVEPGSHLHDALGDRATVNSYHHQAIDRLGDGLRAVAHAPDGIIEAIELDGASFVLAVQWELQEAWRDDPGGSAIFAAFVSAARRRARATAPPPPRADRAAPPAAAPG
jgi:putative glutamine amidotransferase